MQSDLRSLCFSPDGSLLAAGMGDGRIALLRLPEGRREVEWEMAPGESGRVEFLSFSREGDQLLAADKERIVLWDVEETLQNGQGRPAELGRITGSRPALLSPDGELLCVYTGSDELRVWHVAPPFPLAGLPSLARPVALAFSADSRLLATSQEAGPVWVWDALSGRSRAKLTPSESMTLDVAFSPGGRLLATAGRDETVRLWDVQTGNALAALNEPEGWVFAVSFSPDAHWLAAGGNESTVRLYGVRPPAARR
jgi:WD40 repeat protein